MNSGNLDSLSDILSSCSNPNCSVRVSGAVATLTSSNGLISNLKFLNLLYPDCVVFTYNTRVRDNMIFSSAYVKATESSTLAEGLRSSGKYTANELTPFRQLSFSREERILMRTNLEGMSAEKACDLVKQLKSGNDLEVLIKLDSIMTVDPNTGKISDYNMKFAYSRVETKNKTFKGLEF